MWGAILSWTRVLGFVDEGLAGPEEGIQRPDGAAAR